MKQIASRIDKVYEEWYPQPLNHIRKKEYPLLESRTPRLIYGVDR